MKTLSTLLALAIATIGFAQSETTWVGGTFGHENDWNTPGNWSTHQVPDEDSHVIIKFTNSGHYAQPLIADDVQVAAVEIHSLGLLTIGESGRLIVDGSDNYSEGIQCYGGAIVNKGKIDLQNLAVTPSLETIIALQDEGEVFLDEQLQFYQEDPHILTAKR